MKIGEGHTFFLNKNTDLGLDRRWLQEAGLLAGVVFYKDARVFGYLKKGNFKHVFYNKNIFEACEVFAQSNLSVVEKIRYCWPNEVAVAYRCLNKVLDITDKDSFGVNVPVYCLMMLQDDMREYFLAELLKLREIDTRYDAFITDVWMELKDKKDFHLDDANAVVEYYKSIGFVSGADSLTDVIMKFEQRINGINKDIEKNDLIRRLGVYCQKNNETVELFNKIKHELQKL